MEKSKVWFITGASKGLGLILAKKLLSQGFRVATTSRTKISLEKELGLTSENFLPLEMDVTNNESVKLAIQKTVAHFGQIDVVVNNAGYAQMGALEEVSDSEVQQNFNVNVFGSLNVIRNVTPYLRKQKSGHIFNISSIGGFAGNFVGFGIYCSTKFAVAGFTEALAEEMKPFNVHTTLVYPGYFRTNFLDKDSVKITSNRIEGYETAHEQERVHLNDINGNQSNDPEKAAEVFIELSQQENPPIHFFMGEDANLYANMKLELIKNVLEVNQPLSISTGF